MNETPPAPTPEEQVAEEPASENLTPEQFADALMERHIPIISREKAELAARTILETIPPPPKGLLRALAENFRFIDQAEFKTVLAALAEKITADFDNGTFGKPFWTCDTKGKSTEWMQSLLAQKIPEETQGINVPETHADKMFIPPHTTPSAILIFDDWLLSGGHLHDNVLRPLITKLRKLFGKPPKILCYCLFGIAASREDLESKINAEFPDFKVQIFIQDPSLAPLTAIGVPHYAWLEELSQDMSEEHRLAGFSALKPGDSLLCGWWKIPDNIPDALTRTESPYRFIDRAQITPPYHQIDAGAEEGPEDSFWQYLFWKLKKLWSGSSGN